MIHYRCGHCGKNFKVEDALAGKIATCPSCGHRLALPPAAPTISWSQPAAKATNLAEANTLSLNQRNQPRPDIQSGDQASLSDGESGVATRTLPPWAPDSAQWHFLAPPERPDELGRLGLYRVLQVLGAGGMGVVFRAQDPHLERLVALKAMLPALAGDPASKERFFREARAAAALKHPHIVTIYQVGEDRGVPFLAMEFLDGESLEDRSRRVARLPAAEVVRIGREIAEGLAVAHAQGLIHRDIKPANVWLEFRSDQRSSSSEAQLPGPQAASGHVKILDFGLARTIGDQTQLTQAGAIVGTPAYMAPEQAAGKPVDARCDLFSLGCVLYRLCTGEMPFKGSDTLTLLTALALSHPPPPAALNPQVPAELSALVMHLLAKKPEDRPQSATIVAAALRELEGRSGQVAPVVVHAAPARTPRPRAPLFWLLGAGVLCVGVAALFLLGRGSPQEGPVRAPRLAPALASAPFDETQARAHQEAWAKYLGVPVVSVNSIGMKLILIPPGRFLMGSPEKEPGRDDDEQLHPVTITRPYLVGACEVTVGQFDTFVKETNYRTQAEASGKGSFLADGDGKFAPQANWRTPGFLQTNAGPVTCVSWNDALAFCEWLSTRERKSYGLPTEAQWEHACRAGSTTRFSFGEDEGRMGEFAWYEDNARSKAHPVGLKKPNPWGLFDMHGNVLEWTRDWWDEAFYTRSPKEDPTGSLTGTTRTQRGGAFNSDPPFCRSAYRDGTDRPNHRWNNVGFRVVCVLEVASPLAAAPGELPGTTRAAGPFSTALSGGRLGSAATRRRFGPP